MVTMLLRRANRQWIQGTVSLRPKCYGLEFLPDILLVALCAGDDLGDSIFLESYGALRHWNLVRYRQRRRLALLGVVDDLTAAVVVWKQPSRRLLAR